MPDDAAQILTRLEMQDALTRAARARQALLDAIRALPEGGFGRAPEGEWSAAHVLRHVVWVEHYWSNLIREARQAAGDFDMNGAPIRRAAQEAATAAGVPIESTTSPPPYQAPREALHALEGSRRAYQEAMRSLGPEHLQRRLLHPRIGALPMRYAVEHVIEHDWDHAVQIAGLRAQVATHG